MLRFYYANCPKKPGRILFVKKTFFVINITFRYDDLNMFFYNHESLKVLD